MFSDEGSSSEELKSACFAMYSFVSMASSKFALRPKITGLAFSGLTELLQN